MQIGSLGTRESWLWEQRLICLLGSAQEQDHCSPHTGWASMGMDTHPSTSEDTALGHLEQRDLEFITEWTSSRST